MQTRRGSTSPATRERVSDESGHPRAGEELPTTTLDGIDLTRSDDDSPPPSRVRRVTTAATQHDAWMPMIPQNWSMIQLANIESLSGEHIGDNYPSTWGAGGSV
jgi:hypothetical protein